MMVISLSAFAHSPIFPMMADWTEAYNQDGVVVYYDVDNCAGQEVLMIKIENNSTSDENVKLSISISEADGSHHMEGLRLAKNVESGGQFSSECNGAISAFSEFFIIEHEYVNPVVTISRL